MSLGHSLYNVDFSRNECNKEFETESLLSPIVKLNKIDRDSETILIAVTLDNRVYKISGIDSHIKV